MIEGDRDVVVGLYISACFGLGEEREEELGGESYVVCNGLEANANDSEINGIGI